MNCLPVLRPIAVRVYRTHAGLAASRRTVPEWALMKFAMHRPTESALYPWYDSVWLTKYARARVIIRAVRPVRV